MKLPLPPRWLRRLILWPLPVIGGVFYAISAPLWFLAAILLSYKLPGQMRLARSLGLATVYLAVEVLISVSAFLLWVGSGFGWRIRSERFIKLHYHLLRLSLAILVGAGRRLFALNIAVASKGLPASNDADGAPLIVMSRHAGPADSILLMHEVMSWHGRRPRIVMSDLLQFDPAFDILLNRLPNRFISASGFQSVKAISELARGMTNADALVIFPEGGNFTEKRRIKMIERLLLGGSEAAAKQAQELRNVLPPRTAGTLAAFGAAPAADAVFVAHTGIDKIAGIGDLWTALPEHKTLHIQWRVVKAKHLPKEQNQQRELLYQEWRTIDEWIAKHQSESSKETETRLSP